MTKQVLKDFKKVCKNEKLLFDLKLYYAELGTEFTQVYGDIDEPFYDAVCDAFCDVVQEVSKSEELFNEWKERIENLVDNSGGIGWGFSDYIREQYGQIPWVEFEED